MVISGVDGQITGSTENGRKERSRGHRAPVKVGHIGGDNSTCSEVLLVIRRSALEVNVRFVFLLKDGTGVEGDGLVQVFHFISDEKIASVE